MFIKKYLTLVLVAFSLQLIAQDQYHLDLIEKFQSEFGLDQPIYLLSNTESANLENMYIYGDATMAINDVSGFDFTKQQSITVGSAGSNQWDAGLGTRNASAVNKDDILLLSFWAKRTSSNTEVFIFFEDASTFDKDFYELVNFTPDWNQYFVAIKASKNYSSNGISMGLHLATMAQSFELAGFTAFNFGQINIEDVPSTFSTGAYEGIEADAAWRAPAAERIETLRKADISILVNDAEGNPISDAQVSVEMLEHDFGFGSALVTCRFPGNDCYDPTYVEKVNNLDGQGHGFNECVTENALKWDGWEEEWLGSPDETVAAIQYLADNGVEMRGHTLIWPGFDLMPEDIEANKNDLNYVRNRIEGRIDEMINHPVLSELIEEWDVINEITQVRDLEGVFKNDPNFESGREIYQEIIRKVRAQDPEVKLYMNDYVVLSGGGSSTSTVDRYKSYLDEIHTSEDGFDGIGFQGHIGSSPTSIVKIESVFDEFYERYGVPMKVTEYDISELVDPEVQGQYMEDFLTITFSHPSMEAFIMWGFWDGNHWKGNAPMFDINWNLKPSGQAFIDKVFNEWWTSEATTTDTEGAATIRGFKGKYRITVTDEMGNTEEKTVSITENQQVTFSLTGTSSTFDLGNFDVSIAPTIVQDILTIYSKNPGLLDLDIINSNGTRVFRKSALFDGESIQIDLPAGMYFARIQNGKESIVKKLIVQ